MKKYKTYIIFIIVAVIMYFLYQRYMVAKNLTDKNVSEQEQQTGYIKTPLGTDSFGDPVSYAQVPTR